MDILYHLSHSGTFLEHIFVRAPDRTVLYRFKLSQQLTFVQKLAHTVQLTINGTVIDQNISIFRFQVENFPSAYSW